MTHYVGDDQAAALSQQKAANNITNVIASDSIGNFPDINAAEALQRVPGVSIEGQRGEGRFLIVRGAAPNYNSVAMDGAPILSSEADGRTVSLDIYPSEQLSRIEVSKTITPDLPGDSVGGRVNLVTKRAFDVGKRRINANLYAVYNDIVRGLCLSLRHYLYRVFWQR
ncbi:MAG: TonB-dependent receptor plug domain-containing protein [Verrucomicrobia bacterium]|nr:TonB-dependent receptor plug domain-containing protein [Verrucomicrobiota bacterium]